MKKLVILIVCLFSIQAHASTIAAQSNYQQPVQIAVKEMPYSLSPYASQSLQAQYSYLFFDPLVRWGKDKKLEFRLLDKLKPIKANKLRFYLKKNISFHSGNLFTSKDVIWSYKQAMTNKYRERRYLPKLKFNVINDYQFDIETTLKQPQLLDYLSRLFILDSEFYKKYKISHNSEQSTLLPNAVPLPLSGTGPYLLASFYPGVSLQVKANVDYWSKPPVFKSLKFIQIKSDNSRLYAILTDDIDIIEQVLVKKINSVEHLENKSIYQTSSMNSVFLAINEKYNAFFEVETARNAIHLAINQAGMLKHILKGRGQVNYTFNTTLSDNQIPTYDVTRANAIFKKYTAPEKLSLLVMSYNSGYTKQVIVAIKNMMIKVGVKLEVTVVNTISEWNEAQYKHDLLLSTWYSPLIEAENIYRDIFSNSQLSGYLETLFKEQNTTLTLQDKIALFERYQLSNRIIPLFSQNKVWAADSRYDLTNVFSVNAIPYWHQLIAKPIIK